MAAGAPTDAGAALSLGTQTSVVLVGRHDISSSVLSTLVERLQVCWVCVCVFVACRTESTHIM